MNSYLHLAAATIEGNPEATTEAQLGDRARGVLDGIYCDELAAWRNLFEARANQGRATTDIAQAARAAGVGAVDSMLMDIDETLPGRIAEDGAVVFAEQPTATNYLGRRDRDSRDYNWRPRHRSSKGRNPSGRGACGDTALSCLIQGVLFALDRRGVRAYGRCSISHNIHGNKSDPGVKTVQ